MATREQIGENFFKGCRQPTVHNRLEILYRAGYLTKTGGLHQNKLRAIYGLNEKGLKVVAKVYPLPVTNPICKSDSIVHDLCLMDLRKRLKKIKMVAGYFPENVLQACGQFQESEEFRPFVLLNSDAALVLDTKIGKINVAFEFESSPKSVSRYVRKLRDYYLSSKINAVFYVCTTAEIESAIRQAEQIVAAKLNPKIFICQFQKMKNEDFVLTFLNRNNGCFEMS